MKWIVIAGILSLPLSARAETVCRSEEYQDHYVAICIGDETFANLELQVPGTHPAVHGAEQVAAVHPVSASGQPLPVPAVSATGRLPSPQAGSETGSSVRQTAVSVTPPVTQHSNAVSGNVIPSMYRAPRSILGNVTPQQRIITQP